MPVPLSPQKALREWKIYVFVIPSLFLVALFSYFPAVSAVYHSFFDWQGGDFKRFIGMDNFLQVLRDKELWRSFGTISILVVANIFKLIPSIFTAVLIHRLASNKWQYWYRVLVVVPMIVPGLVTLFIWKFFFHPNMGVLNRVIDAIGLKPVLVAINDAMGWNTFYLDSPIGWLSQPDLIIPSLVLWGFPWIGAVGVLIYLAGLQSIGEEVYESAEIDGANWWQKFAYIEFPLILTQVRLTLVLLIIGTLQGFGLQFLLLGIEGGPGRRGMVPGLWMFNNAFNQGLFGYACAIGMVLFVFILILTILNNKFVRVDK